MEAEQKDKTLFVTTIILVVIHLVGVAGILSPYKGLFLVLTPFNLLLSTTLLLINHKNFNANFYIFCFTIFLAGFFVEVIGTNRGFIFGSYSYGNTLGIKFLKTPIIIGVNWLLLIYTVGSIFNKLNKSIYFKSIIGAASLVILDLFIEPVAIKYNFWDWYEGVVPLQNYIAWFIISFIMLILFYKLNFNKENKLAKAMFIVQLVFFVLLNYLK
jgi:putative membrane protein